MYQRVYFINSIIIIFKCELFIYILFQKMRREVIINEATTHTQKNNFITQQDDRRNPVKYNFIRLTFVRRPIIIHRSL